MNISKILIIFILCIIGFVMFIPFLWLVSSSLKPMEDIWVFPPKWIPNPPRWDNYYNALTYLPFGRYILNTLFITFMVLVGVLLTSSIAGYAFARLRFPGKDFIFYVLLSTMMLPYIVTLIPIYIMFKNLGWLDTYKPLIIPAYFGGGAFNIFLFRQFFMGIPQELVDSARIDGAS
ncbi:MAG TPA: carbohydrate ABC transporter permease, partial [bacterium]|nr:carbohydrate ABC transporter permease [bacterium]